jgi:hypothetical protein
MVVDSTNTHTSSSNGKSVLASLPVIECMVYAVMPFNPVPKTPQAKKIVQEARRRSPGLVGAVDDVSRAILFAVTKLFGTGSQVPLLLVIDAI